MTGIEHAQFDLMAYIQQKYQKAVWGAVEYILRNHIDNPIVGELTREKIKAAGIRSVFFQEDPPNLEYEKRDEKEVLFKLTSNLIGVAQGHWMIYYNGARRPLTDKEEAYLASQEQQVISMPQKEIIDNHIPSGDLQMVNIDCPQCELVPLPPEELHKYMKDFMKTDAT